MGVDEGTSKGGGVECCEQGSHSKRGAVNDIIHDFGDGSSGGGEGFLAYKRWRQLRSNAGSKVQEDGRASVAATSCSTKQVFLNLCI
ncbi:hypothetical protein SLEP1_g2119 [Rubroshorea leprosula]|uniref:Uncharacterized protein n=1 Tax=Rubroshorea leprosula TaxID=152421 RepID=A0AAV5HPU6_9ROSI|nr:hypothetical protein SLEP1_g2119 [Rubroshorea leprosula]